MIKIKNSKTGKVVAKIDDEPQDIWIIDEVTGKEYTLEEYQKLKKEKEKEI